MIVESMYQELILEHYKNPQGRGLREPYDAEVHHVNPTCGDEVTLRVKLGDGGKVLDVSYESQGCSISQAAASMLHELATGSTVEESLAVVGDAVAFAGVAKFPARVKCALLAWMAYKDAVIRSQG